MFRKIVVPIILFTSFYVVTGVQAFSFNGKQWHNSNPLPFEASPHQSSNYRVTFSGFSDWTRPTTWFTTDTLHMVDTVNGVERLHLKFYKARNYYYYVPNMQPYDPEVKQMYDSLTTWFIWWNTPPHRDIDKRDHCQLMIDAMDDEYVWYQGCVISDALYRYGKFQWEIEGNFTNFDPDHIDPGLWIYDGTNRGVNQYAGNEIDFEFCKFTLPHPYPYVVSVQPVQGAPDNATGGQIRPSDYEWFDERDSSQNWTYSTAHGVDSTSTHWFLYSPDNVYFHSHWNKYPSDSLTYTFPDTANPHPRRAWAKNWSTGLWDLSAWMVVPKCGAMTGAIMSIYQMWGTPAWAYNANGITRDTVEMIVRSFTYTGIPDLSFTDTLGAPWPWATGEWHPAGWNKSMMVTTDSTVTTTTINSTHSCDTIRYGERAWVYWGVHNVGTDSLPAQTIYSQFYLNGQPNLHAHTLSHSVPIGGMVLDSVELWGLDPGSHQVCVVTGVDYGGTSIEELRKTNNADTINIFVKAPEKFSKISTKSTK